ncbi:MAG TPA: hypothetical protein VMY40_11860 [Anaerolineae bacterium]|nr:hypothetical protein [Anaerolineae bacterium]
MVALWMLAGGAIGTLSGLTARWTVARLGPTAPGRAVSWTVAGAMVRWSLAAGLLIAALQRGIAPTLLAFAGLWLARWGIVYWWYRHA